MAGQCTYRDVDAPALPVILVGVVVQAHTGSPGLEHSKVPPRSHSSSTYLQVYGSATFTLRLLLRLGELRSFGRFGRSSTACTFGSSLLLSSCISLAVDSCFDYREHYLGPKPICSALVPDDLAITSIWSAKRSAIHRLANRCIH